MQRAELRLNGYRTLLRLILVTDALSDASQVALFTGYLGSMTSPTPNDPHPSAGTGTGSDVSLIPPQQRASLVAVRKILLRWASLHLQRIVVECKSVCSGSSKDAEVHAKSRISVFLLALLNRSSCTEEMKALAALGVPPLVLAFRKLLSYQPKANAERLQVILDEGVASRQSRDAACSIAEGGGAHSAGAPPLLSGSEAAVLMKIGIRVLRGPDWKWGDQVSKK